MGGIRGPVTRTASRTTRPPRAGYENGIQNNPPAEKRTFRVNGCPHCGGRFRMGNPVYRPVTDLDQNKKQVAVTVIQGRGLDTWKKPLYLRPGGGPTP